MNRITKNKVTDEMINNEPEKYIKWMCFDVFISFDGRVFDKNLNRIYDYCKDRIIGYTVNGGFKSIKFINENSVNVLGKIFKD